MAILLHFATDEVDTLESFLICDDVAPTAGLYVEDKGAYEHNDLCTLGSGSVVAPATLTTTNSTVGKVQICALASDGTTPATTWRATISNPDASKSCNYKRQYKINKSRL